MTYQSPIDLSTATARLHQQKYGIPERDFLAWKAQRDSAEHRGIPFRFSLLAWRMWWMVKLRQFGAEAKRGKRRDQYVMARIKDHGAYEADNVRCISPGDNFRDRRSADVAVAVLRTTVTRAAKGSPRGFHLRGRGDDHPKSRAVITPLGRYGSIALAADAYGITRQAAFYRVTRGSPGWHYEVPPD